MCIGRWQEYHQLNIKAVCQGVGINANTLRAWERRYAIIAPPRDESNRRDYSLQDVDRLRLIVQLVERGLLIGDLATMSLTQLRSSLAKLRAPEEVPTRIRPEIKSMMSDLMVANYAAVNTSLADLRRVAGPKEFVLETAVPIFKELTGLIANNMVSIAQEHAFSALMRKHLLQYLPDQGEESKPGRFSFAFVTPEGELHEFGILLSCVLTAARGLSVHYFGPNLPTGDCIQGAREVACTHLIVGTTASTTKYAKDPLAQNIKTIAKQLPEATIVVGGPAPLGAGKRYLPENVVLTPTFHHYDRLLDQLELQ